MPALTEEPVHPSDGRSVAGIVWGYIAIVVALAIGAWFAPLAPVLPAANPLAATMALTVFALVAGRVATSTRPSHHGH